MKKWLAKIFTFIVLALFLNIIISINAFAEENVEVIVVYKDKAFDEGKISKLNVKNEEVLKELPIAKMTVPESEIKTLEKNPNVEAVALNEKVKLIKPASITTIDDTTFEQLYNLSLINVYDAWKKGYTGKGVKIAVIDGGVENHKDLKIAGGKSFILGKTYYDDEDGHGTHVAGIINSSKTGIAPDSSIYSLKIFNGDNAKIFDFIKALDWSIANDIDIVNMSLGLFDDNIGIRKAIQNVAKKGILLVAASGNMEVEGVVDPVLYPAAYPEVISVASVNQEKNHSYFSNVGLENELSAPGEKILSTYLKNEYEYLDGTSMAAPHVTGLLAILKQRFPNYSAFTLRKYITETALDLGAKGHDNYYGYGLARFLEPTSSVISDSNITVINNYKKKDVIKFNHLQNNRTYTIYDDPNLENKIVSFQASSSSKTVTVQQLGIAAGAVYITEKQSEYGESVPIKVSYKAEQLPAISSKNVTVKNNFNANDQIVLKGLTKGLTYTIYSDVNLKNKLASFTATSSSKTLSIKQIGSKAGNVYIVVSKNGYKSSALTKVSYSKEKIVALPAKNVTITNNKKGDKIRFKGLMKGFTYTVYSDRKLTKRVISFTAKNMTKIVNVKQIGPKKGAVYVEVRKSGYLSSNATKVNFSGERTSAISKRNVEIKNKKKADTIKLSGLKKGTTIVIYKDVKKLKKLISFKVTNSKKTLKIKQLGKNSGKIYITTQLPGYRVSTTTAVSYSKEK